MTAPKSSRGLATTLAGACVVAAGILLAPAPAFAQTTLKFSHTDTPIGARQKAAELFAKKVEEYTQGRYKVQIFHSGQLANDTKSLEQLQLGGLDFAVTGASTYAPHLKVAALPGGHLRAGLEALRRVQVGEGSVREARRDEKHPHPLDLGSGLSQLLHQAPLHRPRRHQGDQAARLQERHVPPTADRDGLESGRDAGDRSVSRHPAGCGRSSTRSRRSSR
jgi:hypothetical protein